MVCMIAIQQKILMRSYTINYLYAEVIDKELQVMDLAAFTLARDHGMPIRVFNMCKPGALRQVVLGTEEGTTIC